MTEWAVGQRCVSKGEPVLGLGIVTEVGDRNIKVSFPAVQAQRTYAKSKAPLKRVAFEAGEQVQDNEGNRFTVLEVREQDGLLIYLGDTEIMPETELNDTIVYSRPQQKLLAGKVNKPRDFQLRCEAWDIRRKQLGSACRGLVGARIELLPHQLYIADAVSRKANPRVLLSDEVGLGKTIEAGLIFHRLRITGEVKRALCLVPGSLVHQWLTELFRKFNVLFNIMTPGHAAELAKTHPGLNPYLGHQCVIQDIYALAQDKEMSRLIVEAGWDLVIVDEAHHLYWSESGTSREYRVVEDLAAACGGLLLLTATPRQLGLESHFGRLRLLDPDRFPSFERFREEFRVYRHMADIADRVLQGETRGVREEIESLFPKDKDLVGLVPDPKKAGAEGARAFVHALIDRHGTGRMVYRNRRKVLSGFPGRKVVPVPLPSTAAYRELVDAGLGILEDTLVGQRLLSGAPAFKQEEFGGSAAKKRQFLKKAWLQDPRLDWLLGFLREEPQQKCLLICAGKAVVLALQEWLGLAKDIEVAVFHEDLSILERDRQAAYFAKTEGARILISSEIGSEGRNFQFAHRLILFDLPLNPSLLEQRIGRLDRIGQHEEIEIYIPYPEGSPLEYLFQWYHRGLDAFQNHLIEGDTIYEELQQKIFTVFNAVKKPASIEPFIEESRRFCEKLRETVQKGRDRLLELHSFHPEEGEAWVAAIRELDEDPELKAFMDELFDWCGVSVEDLADEGFQVAVPGTHMYVESFPGLPDEGSMLTYDRALAVTREELTFLSYDHPMVTGAVDMFLNLDRGVTGFVVWRKAPEPGIMAQCLFILESPGSDDLRLERFLPPIPLLLAVDQNKKLRPDLQDLMAGLTLEHGPIAKLHQQREALSDILDSLVAVAEEKVEDQAAILRDEAIGRAMNSLKEDYDRLKALAEINPSVRVEELDGIEERLNEIVAHLEEAKPRLDAVRLVMMVP